ncbi:pyridoxal-dependent decarboxylase [Methylonatrum kenyense]|uniref:pyridoxal phosphate-dependent decarboxylase family protein n=1 Tax=Methylonatrum kenyense TaxID=455253 RepID=UPI0020BE626D|nr:pyridoxal-dependent decarboxylase [Methylonatrum kenyense]
MNRFQQFLPALGNALERLDAWRESFGTTDGYTDPDPHQSPERIEDVLLRLEQRLEENYPFHHPAYAGQMLKPPHPAAWLAYTLAMTINPNNHALDGGPPTSELEKAVIMKLAGMVGYDETCIGHLTSGGTIANLEALFVARETHPSKAIAASANAHFTHRRMCRVLNAEFVEIPVDARGLPELGFIERNAEAIGTIVVTLGTTGLGIVEPLVELLALARRHGIRIHLDGAYGGFFTLIRDSLPSRRHWEVFRHADSIVIDPHKHGLQPYGCGSVLYKDASIAGFLAHDSPYTYFTSDDLHLGEISLECSRAGASAAAFWATLELLPLDEAGLGQVLASARQAAVRFADRIQRSPGWTLYREPDLDIVGYFKTPESKRLSALNRINRDIFQHGMDAGARGYYLSLYTINAVQFLESFPDYEVDTDKAVILRSVFMKEEHKDFVDELATRLGI